eukprot:gene24748-biopygen2939
MLVTAHVFGHARSCGTRASPAIEEKVAFGRMALPVGDISVFSKCNLLRRLWCSYAHAVHTLCIRGATAAYLPEYGESTQLAGRAIPAIGRAIIAFHVKGLVFGVRCMCHPLNKCVKNAALQAPPRGALAAPRSPAALTTIPRSEPALELHKRQEDNKGESGNPAPEAPGKWQQEQNTYPK